jgi:hypothetical protein
LGWGYRRRESLHSKTANRDQYVRGEKESGRAVARRTSGYIVTKVSNTELAQYQKFGNSIESTQKALDRNVRPKYPEVFQELLPLVTFLIHAKPGSIFPP